jgi:hypothetical protein
MELGDTYRASTWRRRRRFERRRRQEKGTARVFAGSLLIGGGGGESEVVVGPGLQKRAVRETMMLVGVCVSVTSPAGPLSEFGIFSTFFA